MPVGSIAMTGKFLSSLFAHVSADNYQKLRFLISGGINVVAGLAVFPALVWLSPFLEANYILALCVAQVICVMFAYLNYKTLVFRTRGNYLSEFAKFSSFYVSSFGINLVALPFLVEVIGLPLVPAQIGFMLVMTVGSYFWHARVTFRNNGVSGSNDEELGRGQ
jgi:putative flippase GtrA